jgi:hypothetical protein
VVEEQVDALMAGGGVIDLVMMPLQKLHDEPTEFGIVFDE